MCGKNAILARTGSTGRHFAKNKIASHRQDKFIHGVTTNLCLQNKIYISRMVRNRFGSEINRTNLQTRPNFYKIMLMDKI